MLLVRSEVSESDGERNVWTPAQSMIWLIRFMSAQRRHFSSKSKRDWMLTGKEVRNIFELPDEDHPDTLNFNSGKGIKNPLFKHGMLNKVNHQIYIQQICT